MISCITSSYPSRPTTPFLAVMSKVLNGGLATLQTREQINTHTHTHTDTYTHTHTHTYTYTHMHTHTHTYIHTHIHTHTHTHTHTRKPYVKLIILG
jgi:ABC-type nickel/cobalt efflux system permease component RcnA